MSDHDDFLAVPEEPRFLRIKQRSPGCGGDAYCAMLNSLLIAEAILAKKDNSAMQHFIAVVKELERFHGFRFEYVTETELKATISARDKWVEEGE